MQKLRKHVWNSYPLSGTNEAPDQRLKDQRHGSFSWACFLVCFLLFPVSPFQSISSISAGFLFLTSNFPRTWWASLSFLGIVHVEKHYIDQSLHRTKMAKVETIALMIETSL